MSNEIPQSVRIRTNEGNEWRYDAIEKASEFYDCNRSNAVSFACTDVLELIDGIERVLERTDLTHAQREETAAAVSSGNIEFSILDIHVLVKN